MTLPFKIAGGIFSLSAVAGLSYAGSLYFKNRPNIEQSKIKSVKNLNTYY